MTGQIKKAMHLDLTSASMTNKNCFHICCRAAVWSYKRCSKEELREAHNVTP